MTGMPNEVELRLHRCCFTGHRPEKLNESPDEIKAYGGRHLGGTDRCSEEKGASDDTFDRGDAVARLCEQME